jgi:hypothetical protein
VLYAGAGGALSGAAVGTAYSLMSTVQLQQLGSAVIEQGQAAQLLALAQRQGPETAAYQLGLQAHQTDALGLGQVYTAITDRWTRQLMQQGADPNTAQRIAHDRLKTWLYANSQKNTPASNVSIPTQGAAGNGATPPPNAAGNAEVNAATASPAGNAANNTAIPTGTTAVGSENPVVPSGNAGIPVNAAAVTPEPTTTVPFTETGIVDKPNTAQTSTQGFSPVNTTQQNMLLQTQNQQADFQQSTVQSEKVIPLGQNNFANTQSFSDLSEQVAPRDQRTTVPTKPTKQQLLEAEIDQAFHEVFETNQPNPTEDNPHAAVFDEMADDLYQTMLQEQAKEEAAAGLTPIPNQAKAPESSTQGWTNNGNIQYNDSGDTAFSQQESLRQFCDETKQRFSAVKLLFGTQPYGSFQPAFDVADGKNFFDYNYDDILNRIDKYTNKLNNATQYDQDKNNLINKDPSSEYTSNTKRNRIGDFSNLEGSTINDIIDRIPDHATMRKLYPVEVGATEGFEFKWIQEGHTYRVRIHNADAGAPVKSNAANGWIVRVQRGKQYYDSTIHDFQPAKYTNPKGDFFDENIMNNTHIPIKGPYKS